MRRRGISAALSRIGEGVGIALDSLRANKIRAALTILGVAIAIGAVLSGLLIWWNPAATVFGQEDASALDAAGS